MKQAFLKDDAFLADVARVAKDRSSLNLWWLGQSGFLLQYQEQHLLIDPYLSDSLSHKYAGSDKPHIRMTERVIAPEKLDFIDGVSSSHLHTDHLDSETLVALMEVNPKLKIIVPTAIIDLASQRLEVDKSRLSDINLKQSVTVGAFTLHGVRAAHEKLEYDQAGHPNFMGYIIQVGKFTLYHSGDTVLFDGLRDELSKWKIDLAFLPINGSDPARDVAGNLSASEAVKLAKDLTIGCVIPCHFDMFTFNTASPETFIDEARKQGQAYKVLQNGERFSLKGDD